MIDSKEISIIVQGPINQVETPKCLMSIREFLPDGEIILSTWEGSDVEGLDYDKIVFSKDPKAEIIDNSRKIKVYNNANRQLLSMQEGLKLASRKYAMKLRSDLILTSDKFLEYFDKFQERTANYNLFERKLLTSTLFTRFNIKCKSQYNRVKIPFHISDWWLFGLREDINLYFADTQLVKEPEFTNYFRLEENKDKDTPYGNSKFKFAPEQYFGYSCFSRNFENIRMEDAADSSDELIEIYRECLVNNFIILEFEQSGIYLNKYPFSKNTKEVGDDYIGMYNFYRYESEYKKFCDKNYEVTTKGFIYKNEELGCSFLRIFKHATKLSNPSVSMGSKLGLLFVILPYLILKFVMDSVSNALFSRKKH